MYFDNWNLLNMTQNASLFLISNKEAATAGVRKNFAKFTCARVSFLTKLQTWGMQLY